MSTKLRCVQAILHWAYDKELYLSTQSSRSWAYGDEYFTLRFTLPPLPREVSGLRLTLQPCPISITIQSAHFIDSKSASTWHGRDLEIKAFGTLEARVSPYAEPANVTINNTCAIIQASPKMLKSVNKGGTLEMVLCLSFSDALVSTAEEFVLNPAEDLSKKGLMPATARELQEMHNEVMTLNAVVKDFYRSNTWQWTMWCRDFSAMIRRSPLWTIYLVLAKKLQNSFYRPLRATAGLGSSKVVDIIVPVYNSFEQTQRCLHAILKSSSVTKYELIVVDDASFEREVIDFLDELAAAGKITLLRNKTNADYTAAVNRGMQLHTNRDVVLLNSDTVVSNNWLDRLQRTAQFRKRIGTVTPFSNNASICSYPQNEAKIKHLPEYNPQQIDLLFATTNDGNIVRIPTAVGFCMYIKRKCLARVGYFDSEAFPGYGEENDFCMRANKLGWWHVLATDTFVFHEGGSSYGKRQSTRKRIAYDFLVKIHPEFQELVNEFVRIDPALPFRRNIDFRRMQIGQKPIILLVLHEQSGGTEKHVFDLVDFFKQEVNFLSLRVFGEHIQLRWLNEGEGFWQQFQMPTGYNELRSLLKQLPIERIHVHHILGLESIISDLIRDLDLPFDFTAHDFYTVCPRGWLCDYRQHYCGQPDDDGCNACLAALPNPKTVKIQQWRKQYSWLIEEAQRVFVPSKDTLMRLKQYIPVANYILAPHLNNTSIPYRQPQAITLKPDEPLRIVVLGLLNAEKGSDLLDACAIDACKRELPLEFHFLGAAHRPLSGRPLGALLIYGRYEDSELQDLLQQVRPHVAWFPAQCPETFSYTLSACLEAGLPIVAPDIGAFSERLAGRNWSWIRPWQQKPEEWNDFLVKISNDHFTVGIAPALDAREKTLNTFSYAKDYLQPFRLDQTIPEYRPTIGAAGAYQLQ